MSKWNEKKSENVVLLLMTMISKGFDEKGPREGRANGTERGTL